MTTHITTQRLILRDMTPSDCQRLFLMDADVRVLATLFGCSAPNTVEDSSRAIEMIIQQYADNGIGRWAVIEKESGLFIGWAGLKIEKNVNGHNSFYDLGYRFIPEYWNKGYATEACRALVAYGFKVLNLEKICAYVESDNTASRHVAEKAGLRVVDTFPGERVEELWLEVLRADVCDSDGNLREEEEGSCSPGAFEIHDTNKTINMKIC